MTTANATEALLLDFQSQSQAVVSTPTEFETDSNLLTTGYVNASYDATTRLINIPVHSGVGTIGFGSYIPENYTGGGAIFLYAVIIKDSLGNVLVNEEFNDWSGSLPALTDGESTAVFTGDNGVQWSVYSNATSIFDGLGTEFASNTANGDKGIVYPADGAGPFAVLMSTDITIADGVTGVTVDLRWGYQVYNGGNESRTFALGFQNDTVSTKDLFGFLTAGTDTTPPTLAITSSAAELDAGATAVITFTFSEDPADSFTLNDIGTTGGTLGPLTGSGLVRTAVFTATAGGTAAITVLAGSYADTAGNLSISEAALNLTVAEAVTAPAPTVDGVAVVTTPAITPGGHAGSTVFVPIVAADRPEQSGGAATADIPLATQNGQQLMLAKVHTGFGLTASGGVVKGNAASLAELIAAIKATASANGSGDATHLTNGGTSFLSLLPSDASLLVETIRLSGSAANSTGALDLVGNAATSAAIVLDATKLPSGNHITLSDIPFAAVFGAVHVTGTTSGQILTGDAANQTFVVATDLSSSVFSGGGADTLQFGATAATSVVSGSALASASGVAAAAGIASASTTLLHGGTAADVAVFNGSADQFTIVAHDGYVLVSSKAAPEQVAKVINVEQLQFIDQTIAVESRAELSTLAGLYSSVLGRQADSAGFDFWGSVEHAGTSLGQIAVELLSSAEGVARFGALNHDAAHDVELLYQALFERAADAAGKAFWMAQMANGATLTEVAKGMAVSAEIVGHQQAATDWDFTV